MKQPTARHRPPYRCAARRPRDAASAHPHGHPGARFDRSTQRVGLVSPSGSISDGPVHLFSFYPSEQVCEDQRWWVTTQGWWTWDDSACATNGNDRASFSYFDGLAGGSRRAAG
ncbi:hypothetical protein [Plantactinospora sp. CA-290183]|uniref:hypothetical protein n=1 Tax=Plantactinospora sp. CA-290183 TaxID=3240006 RepID=UPI003D8D3A74